MEKGDDSFEMISSVEDFMGRLAVASERRLCQCAQPDRAILCLGLPAPNFATNAVLKQLLPIYTEIVSDIRQNSEQSIFLCPLFEAKSNVDAAVLLVYFLEFPNLVRSVRGDTTGIADCRVQEKFELTDIADEITTNKVLLQWCREAVADFGSHHVSVLASAISFLTALDATRTISKSRAKKLIRKVVFRDKSDTEGFAELRSDLARLVVARTDLPYQAVVNSILMQIHILCALHGEAEVFSIMEKAPNIKAFDLALTRVKPDLKESEYQMFRTMLGVSQSVQELLQAQSVPQGKKAGETVRCDKEGCDKTGSLRCTGCRLANYCSKECQVFHWKHGHAQECLGSKKKKSTKELSEIQIQAAAARARQKKSPALADQDRLLSEHGEGVDYVIVLPTGKHDVGVCFAHTLGKLIFRLARERASGGSLFEVSRMYDMLSGLHPHLKDVIRAQLQAEYGVDPLSEEAKSAPREEVSIEDIEKATSSGGIDMSSLYSALLEQQSGSTTQQSNALAMQDKALEQNPVVDYIVWSEEDGKPDCAIELLDRLDKLGYRTRRLLAPKSSYHLGRMYKQLVDSQPELKNSIRKQMLSEYGMDPASEKIQNLPFVEPDEIMEGIHEAIVAGWPTTEQLREKSLLFAPGNEKYLWSWFNR